MAYKKLILFRIVDYKLFVCSSCTPRKGKFIKNAFR